MKKGSQNDLILKDLQKGYRITPLTALRKYGCLRLSGRIFELKEIADIKTNIIECNGKRIAEYYI